MKMKYLIIVGLILAILTIGAASATDDVAADDAVAADNVTEDPIEEVAGDEVIASAPLTEEDFDVEVEEIIALNSNEDVISFYCRDEQTNGSITVYVDENENPAVDQTVEYMEFGLNLNQLGITTAGIHKLVANYVPASGDSIKLIDTTVNVTEEEGYTGLNVYVYNVIVNDYNGVAPLVYYSCGLDHGNILIYVDNEVYYNKTVTSDEVIYLENLDKKIVCGKRFVQVKYFDGENTTVVKSKMARIDYKFGVFNFYEDTFGEVHKIYLEDGANVLLIDAPEDITGDLYVIFNGTEQKIDYENGRGEFTIPEEAFRVGSTFNLSVEYRGDDIYPSKTVTYEVEISFRVKHPYLMGLGDNEFISLNLPEDYSGVLNVYYASEDPVTSEYKKDSLFDSAEVIDGKASVSLSPLPEGQYYLIAEFVVDDAALNEYLVLVDVMKNNDNISATVEPTSIDAGESVTLKIISQNPEIEPFEIYVDDEYVDNIIISDPGEKNRTYQFTTAGEHIIKVSLYAQDLDSGKEIFFSKNFVVTVNAVEPLTEDDFDVHVKERIHLDSKNEVIEVICNGDATGNITVYVDESATPAYNKACSGEVKINLSDLGISTIGLHKIVVNYVPTFGDSIELADKTVNVTEEGVDGLDVRIYDVFVNGWESDEDPLVYYYTSEDLEGNILIYVDNELYFNKTLSVDDEIYLEELDKKLNFTDHFVQVKYFDGEKTIVVSSKTVNLDYGLYATQFIDGEDVIYVGGEGNVIISLPDDATGDLYVILNGNEREIDYESGYGTFTIPAEFIKLGKNITLTVELRNDATYLFKNVTYNVEVDFRVDHPSEMAVGDNEFISVDLPSEYSGVLKVYTTTEDPNEPDIYIKDKEFGSADVVNGKASISLSELPAKYHYLIVELTSGGEVYRHDVWFDVKENSNEVSATVEPASIEVGNSVTVKITGNSSLKQNFRIYVDGEFSQYVSIYGVGEKTVTIQFTTVGDHKIKVYGSDEDGEGDYDAVFFSKTFTVSVKAKETPSTPTTPTTPAKKATKITAKKATFKAKKKVKKYTITLKAGKAAVKKVKVTLKIGKKTFKATTNAKGKATFKIKKLTKKGKYNAVVKFAGKGNYLKTSKKVKITIK